MVYFRSLHYNNLEYLNKIILCYYILSSIHAGNSIWLYEYNSSGNLQDGLGSKY